MTKKMQMNEVSYQEEIIRRLKLLNNFISDDNTYYRALFNDLRSFYLPSSDSKYADSYNFSYPVYDATPISILERATSGFLSVHYSKTDKFFALEDRDYSLISNDEIDVNLENALNKMTGDIHSIIQMPTNFEVLSRAVRDSIVFGIKCVSVEEDDQLYAKFSHHMPENVSLTSINGNVFDVFGVREKLNIFHYMYRFPSPIFVADGVNNIDGDTPNLSTSEDGSAIWVYRQNIEAEKLDYFLKYGMADDRDYVDYYRQVFGLSADKKKLANQWVDFWFSDKGLLSTEINESRRIFTSFFTPPHETLGLGRGPGEKSIPTYQALTEIESITLVAFERTFQPAWSVPNEETGVAFNLERDHLNYLDPDSAEPKPLSLGIDIGQAVDYQSNKLEKMEYIMGLDIFRLINKDRMTEDEVSIRRSDSYKNLGLHLAEDEARFLVPFCASLVEIVHKRKPMTELLKRVVSARFISPLSFVSRDSIFDKAKQTIALLREGAELLSQDTPLNDITDVPHFFKKALISLGQVDMIRNEEEYTMHKGQRENRMANEARISQMNAVTAANNALLSANPQQSQQGSVPQNQSNVSNIAQGA